jgi:hypothetical protein
MVNQSTRFDRNLMMASAAIVIATEISTAVRMSAAVEARRMVM